MKKKLIVAGVLLGLVAAVAVWVQMNYFSMTHDLKVMCDAAKTMNRDSPKDPVEAAVKFGEMIRNGLTSTPGMNTFTAITNVDPRQKYDLILQAAREEGVKDWSCPELKEYLRPKF